MQIQVTMSDKEFDDYKAYRENREIYIAALYDKMVTRMHAVATQQGSYAMSHADMQNALKKILIELNEEFK